MGKCETTQDDRIGSASLLVVHAANHADEDELYLLQTKEMFGRLIDVLTFERRNELAKQAKALNSCTLHSSTEPNCSSQPRRGKSPVPIGGARRKPQSFRDFWNSQTHKVAKFYDLGGQMIFGIQRIQRLMDGENLLGGRAQSYSRLV